MYVTPGVLFLAGIGVGVFVSLAAIVTIALVNNKKEEK